MNPPSASMRIFSLVFALLLFALSSTMAWATVNDYSARQTVPEGVTVAGTDLSGMNVSETRTAIEHAVAAPLTKPLPIEVAGNTRLFDPRAAIRVDVEAMLLKAVSPRREAPYLARLRHDAGTTRLPLEIAAEYSLDGAVIDEWIGRLQTEVAVAAVNASITVDGDAIRVTTSRAGRALDAEGARELITKTLTQRLVTPSESALSLPLRVLEPRITDDRLGKTIVVDLSRRRIRLYDGAVIEKTYRCAIGTPSHPTPQGRFKIVQKRYRPTWSNPGSTWAVDMPASIPPGPSNPLGTRALNLNAPGIRIHGTTKTGSIGSAASHGCMRMVRGDIEDLYERVNVGTRVFIVR